MSLAVVADADIQLELWRSFASVVKSYAAAASMSGTEYHIPELDEEDLQIHAKGQALYLLYHVHTQRGQWSIAGAHGDRQSGSFRMDLNGTFVFEDGALDMDHAAIELIGRLSKSLEAVR
jgi:hypothetical protein